MFTDLTKVQVNQETEHVHLAIKISDNHAHNLVFELSCFILLMQPDVKWSGYINGKKWSIQKLPSKVKLYSENYEFHYRFTLEQWDIVRTQFARALRKSKLA